jgi:hypothetical protein
MIPTILVGMADWRMVSESLCFSWKEYLRVGWDIQAAGFKLDAQVVIFGYISVT